MELHATHLGSANSVRPLAEAFLELIAPTRCAGCDAYGPILCHRCAQEVWGYDSALACARCGAPFGWLVCTECWDRDLPLAFTVVLGPLEGSLARAVVLHKDHNERRLGPALGGALGTSLILTHPGWGGADTAVTWVPPSAAALRRRDFDHGLSLARGVGLALGCAPTRLLAHRGAKDNRALGRTDRSENVRRAFEVIASPPQRVLLVDDVVTTGATAASCAELLLESGAAEVALAAVARAW